LWDQPILQDSVNGHTCPPCGRRSSRLEGGLGGFIRSGKFRLLLPSINTPMGTQRFRQVFALDRLGQRSYLPPLRTALFPSGRGAGGIHSLREISLIITIDQHTDGNAAIPSGLCPRQARATVILAPLADGAFPVRKGGGGDSCAL